MSAKTAKTAVPTMSGLEARRIALAAQGFTARGRGTGDKTPGDKTPTAAALRAAARRVHVFQMDPINVLIRSHYLPAYSRLGSFPLERLDGLCYRDRGMFEYVGHEWSLVSTDLHPLLRWRMAAFAGDPRWVRDLPEGYPERVLAELADRGPLTATEVTEAGKSGGGRFSAAPGKRALHWLTQAGRVAVAERRGLQQVYDLPERVIPADVLDKPTPDRDDARRELLLVAAKALGVATAKDLVSYFLLGMGVAGVSERVAYPKTTTAAKLVQQLAGDGLLQEVTVDGWPQPAYLHPDAPEPAEVSARALLSPFDSLLWERDRTERLFGFRYRIEIYTPAAKREYGYYVLPMLLGEHLVGRLDLKADRKAGTLCVPGAFTEKGVDPKAVAGEIAAELDRMRAWLGLDGLSVGTTGNLAAALSAAVA